MITPASHVVGSTEQLGFSLEEITTTHVKVILGKSGYARLNASDKKWDVESYNGKYVKLVGIA